MEEIKIDIPRNIYKKGFFHVMVQGLNKEYIFNQNHYKEKYINLIKKKKKKYNILLLAYWIMDNHAHLLVYVEKVQMLSFFMQNINSKYAIYYNKDKKRVGYVFRGRFNSQYINNDEYLLNCLNYIHMNPVNARMRKRPEDYQYSSYNDYINKTGIVNNDVLNELFNKTENYLDIFLNLSNEEFEVMDIDREEKNFSIAMDIFLVKNNITIDELKTNNKLLKELCQEVIIKKSYNQGRIIKLLNVSESKISRIVRKIKNQKND